ncbi:MAG: DNA mismatch repair endonuclease MutL [Thermoguttaceae bacterium]|nr:DNA mismatch repair endonuclease MutL [Thermoguttaceae bacterium]
MPPVIRALSKSMINKIAAGEVIERPANVVKELVENAIDAGATRITIEVEKGGTESIRVIDDGCGVPADQLKLALSPHATSKLSEPDDLFRIHTLGFRGEALASIAEISRLAFTSRSAESPEGARIESDGGQISEPQPVGRSVGTSVEARNLFFNVPARRKFLKSYQTEFARVQEATTCIALPNPNVAFVLKHNSRIIYNLPPNESFLERIRRIFKEDVASRLVPVETTYKEVKVEGYVGKPELTRGTNAMQYLFLNGRYIKDRSLSHAIQEAYRGLVTNGVSSGARAAARYPVVFLNVRVPADFVDFNVHPTKMEVRFVDAQGIYAGLLHSIRNHFLNADVFDRPSETELSTAAERSSEQIARENPAPEKSADPKPAPSDSKTAEASDGYQVVYDVPNDPENALDEKVLENRRENYFKTMVKSPGEPKPAERPPASQDAPKDAPSEESAKRVAQDARAALVEAASRTAASRASTGATSGASSEFRKFPPLPGAAPKAPEPQKPVAAPEPPKSPEPSKPAPAKKPAPKSEPTPEQTLLDRVKANNIDELRPNVATAKQVARTSKGLPVVQMCDRYLVMEAPDGIAIVDQHALHERILYEKLKANLEKGSLDVQLLLIAETVELTPREKAKALEIPEVFEKLGLVCNDVGGNAIAISGYPALLRDLLPSEIFLTILETYIERRGKVERSDLVDFALKQTACKAAIKAGDRLTPDSIIALVAAAEGEVYAHHCPHGRPSTLIFTRQELDKLFKRT